MAHRHGKGREKKGKESPAEKRRSTLVAIFNSNLAILCELCDKTDCVNKFQCKSYKTKEEQDIEDPEGLDEDDGEEIESSIALYWKVLTLIDGETYRQIGWEDRDATGGTCVRCGYFELDKDNEVVYCDCKHTKYERQVNK